jgi:hypothetical protein
VPKVPKTRAYPLELRWQVLGGQDNPAFARLRHQQVSEEFDPPLILKITPAFFFVSL